MLVMKFGGTSVGDPVRLRELVGITQGVHRRQVVLVCSAMAGVTNMLIGAARVAISSNGAALDQARRQLWNRHKLLADALIKDDWERETLFKEWGELIKTFDRITTSLATLGERSPKLIDAVAALGERFSVRLVAALLRTSGIAAQAVDATELLVTDDNFGAARPLLAPSRERTRARLEPMLRGGIVPVVTGYIGATASGVVTTLGRGGSDYSAALLGAALDAEEVWIWTDVNGILTADPKIVPDARTIAEISYIEAAELATFGAEVLHPKTLAPVAERGIPLHIANTFNPDHPGTRIVAEPRPSSEVVRAIISARHLTMLAFGAGDLLTSEGWSPEFAARALRVLADAGVEVLMFAQSFSERSLTLVVREADGSFARASLDAAFAAEQLAGHVRAVRVTEPVATVSVVGAPNSDGAGLVPRAFAALGIARARVLAMAQSAAAYHVSFVLHEAAVDEVVRVLHRELGLGG